MTACINRYCVCDTGKFLNPACKIFVVVNYMYMYNYEDITK